MLLIWFTDGTVWITAPNCHHHRFVITEHSGGPRSGLFTLEDRKFDGKRGSRGTVVRRQDGLRSLVDAKHLAQIWEDERFDHPVPGRHHRRRYPHPVIVEVAPETSASQRGAR